MSRATTAAVRRPPRGSLARPGSVAWLALHELRLALRAQSRSGVATWLGYVLLALWLALGCAAAWGLRHTAIPAPPFMLTAILLACAVALSFMTAQAMLASQRTLYQSGDLSLLLSAPLPERTVLLAKLLGIAGAIALTYAIILLPIVVPVAAWGHPRLFGIVAVLLALALAAAALGLAVTLLLARLIGPGAARTVGQVLAALLGGALFLASQLLAHGGRSGDGAGGANAVLFERLRAGGIGSEGWSALPGRAAFGDPLAILALLGTGVVLFVAAGTVLQRAFLTGYQDGGAKVARARASGRASARLFHPGLTRSVFAKEWRLLVRDPALAFQIVLRLIYMAPLVIGLFGGRHTIPIPAALAFASVLLASQLIGSFAWLTISAEDAPDLLVVAPVEKGALAFAKLLAAFAMAAPFALVLPVAIAVQTVPGALFTLLMTVLGGGAAGFVELKLGKPAPRAAFNRRRGGSAVAGIVSVLVALLFGAAAAAGVFWLTGGFAAFN